MRVLHVYGGRLLGGIEAMLVTIARHQQACPELAHAFAVSGDGPVAGALRAAGGTLHPLPAARASRPLSVWRARRVLRQVLRAHQFDRVICHAAWPYAMFGAAARDCGVPLVMWVHDALTGRHWIERWARRTPPDLAICNSSYTAGTVPALFGDVPRTVVYGPHELAASALTTEARARIRAGLATRDDATVIIQAGRLEPYKGHAVLLAALGMLRDLPDWVFWLVGGAQRPFERDYLTSLERQALTLGIADRVRFPGYVADLLPVLQSADLQCQPNVRPEPFGSVFIEALSAGLPVIGSRGGGVADIVDDSCGVLVAPGNVEELARALRALLTDPHRRRALAQSAPARARRLCDPATQLSELWRVLTAMDPGRGA